jgi:predicted lipoprotein with Yx(FWY)xxD motif
MPRTRSRLRRYAFAATGLLAATALIAGACGDDDDDDDANGDTTPVATEPADPAGGISPAADVTPPSDDTPAATDETPANGANGESTTVSVAETDLGAVLVGPDGLTLYTFANDVPDSGSSACTDSCAQAWPPLTVEGDEPTAAAELTGALEVITRDDGSSQVTYNGQPLYYYVQDQAPGDTTGDGVGGVWDVATP